MKRQWEKKPYLHRHPKTQDEGFPLTVRRKRQFFSTTIRFNRRGLSELNYKPNNEETDVMKTLLTILSILSIALFASCGGGGGEEGGDDNSSADTNGS
tara:strand:+ start:312 stop:605 length:294 start_codon:yes stop_codon:yes gene_type:complete